MTDFSKLKVSDIKQMLIDEGKFTKEELENMDVKGKTGWVEVYQDAVQLEDTTEEMIWEDAAELMDGVTPEQVRQPRDPDMPKYTDPEWNDFVMSLFTDDEVIDGGKKNKYPTLNGMRRIAELLLGEITFTGPIKIKTTMHEGIGKSVVTYQVIFDWKLDAFYNGQVSINEGYPQKIFQSVASSWEDNTPPMFQVFTETIAENRAEARTLRRALRLKTVSYEELPGQDTVALIQKRKESKPTTGDWNEDEKISDTQINTIELMCKRLKIDLQKFINSGKKQYENIDQVSRSAAAGMIQQLNRYQSSGEDAVEIPLNLIGETK